MANPWFRLYAEFEDDPKVQMMPEAMQRRLLMVFCSHSKGETLTDAQRAFKWRLSLQELAETKALFLLPENAFIDEDWTPTNWNKRQYLSDSSTPRVKKHRDKQALKQDETFPKQAETVTVTPPDTEAETDSNSEAEQKDASAESLRAPRQPAGTIPLNTGKSFTIFEDQVLQWTATYPAVDVRQELREIRAWCDANPRKRKTKNGVLRFVIAWLSREQDKPGIGAGSNGNSRETINEQRLRKALEEVGDD